MALLVGTFLVSAVHVRRLGMGRFSVKLTRLAALAILLSLMDTLVLMHHLAGECVFSAGLGHTRR